MQMSVRKNGWSISNQWLSTRSHGSEGGRARERAWELVDFLSITCCCSFKVFGDLCAIFIMQRIIGLAHQKLVKSEVLHCLL